MRFREGRKVLLALGFQERQGKGSHVVFRHPDGRYAVVPNHGRGERKRGTLASISRSTGVPLPPEGD